MSVFFGQEHKTAFFVKRNSGGICINGDETASAPSHGRKNMFYLEQNCSANVISGILFVYGETAYFNCRVFFTTF